MDKAVLLINLGSPNSPTPSDVKIYLKEFLMDEYVIDIPKWIRYPLVNWIIAPFRSKQSAEAYQSVWTEEGSPLITISENQQKALQKRIPDIPVYLAMRYQHPSIKDTLKKITHEMPELKKLYVVPLYPHYAMATTKTVVKKVQEEIQHIAPHIDVMFQDPFYKHPSYINALAKSIRTVWEKGFDHLLFSYHGIPVRHLKKTDITGSHCKKAKDCCNNKNSQAHSVCYLHQVKETTYEVIKKLNIPDDKYSISFQSRLGKDEWLSPFTNDTVTKLAQSGIKKLAVVCPAFIADCLETIEEIGDEAEEIFHEHGGKTFELIPCLNDNNDWISVLEEFTHHAFNQKSQVSSPH